LSEELTTSFCQSNPEIARNFAYLTFLSDNRPDLKKLRVPSLLLQCQEDPIAPREVGEYLHQQLQDSTLVILDATGHCPNLSAPAPTIAAMKDFLKTDIAVV
jgi:sigma-B regulation protein RsbQ